MKNWKKILPALVKRMQSCRPLLLANRCLLHTYMQYMCTYNNEPIVYKKLSVK